MDQTFKKNLALGSIITLLVFVPFFSGGRNNIFAFLIAIIFVLFAAFFIKDSPELPDFKNKYVLSFAVFLIVATISTFISPNFFVSLSALLWWLIYFLVFVCCSALFKNKVHLEIFLKVMIAVAVIFGIIGIFLFLKDADPYLRMQPIFEQHNAFGAFLLLPIFSSLGFFMQRALEKKTKAHWFIVSAFLISILFLTFSRGSMLSLVAPTIVGIIFFIRIYSGKVGLKISGIILSIFLGAAVCAGAVFYFHGLLTKNTTEPVIIYQNETAEANGMSLRFHYWKDAVDIFLKKPLAGVGLGNYPEGLRVYRSIDALYTADPHNMYLKVLAETGIGGIAAIIFLLLIFITIVKRIRTFENPLNLMFALGIVALLIHGGMDADWWFPANTLVFFAAAGGSVASETKGNSRKIFGNILFVLSVIIFIFGFLIFKTVNHLEDGKFFVMKDKKDLAREEFKAAESTNYFKNSDVPFWWGVMDDTTQLLDEALQYSPQNASIYQAKAEALMKLKGDEREIEKNLQAAITFNPASSYMTTIELADLYITQGRKNDAKKLLEENLPWFERYQSSDVFKSDPNKDLISSNIKILTDKLDLLRK